MAAPSACPACGGELSSSVPYPGGTPAATPPAGLRFERIGLCAGCGLGLALPRPTQRELDAFYASGAYWHAAGGSRAQISHETNQARHRVLRCLPHLAGDGAVADIGAGHGGIAEWLDRLTGGRVQRYDFVEPDAAGRNWILARPASFAKSAHGSLSALGRDYALIFLNHVLEHVADPAAFLEETCAHLRPGGIAYVETPHADQRFKPDVFPHTLFFTAPALTTIARRLGLEVIECASFGTYPGARGAADRLRARLLAKLFGLSVRMRMPAVERLLDDSIWNYRSAQEGIWLRCLLRRVR